jgi:glycerol-3-phosphate responsive antiterminator
VTGERTDVRDRLRHGASIINVAAGARTPEIVRLIDAKYPDVPIIASGGNTPESIRATIKAGANAITYTPPSSKQLFSEVMEKYREPK